jgi:hypothetical protein
MVSRQKQRRLTVDVDRLRAGSSFAEASNSVFSSHGPVEIPVHGSSVRVMGFVDDRQGHARRLGWTADFRLAA